MTNELWFVVGGMVLCIVYFTCLFAHAEKEIIKNKYELKKFKDTTLDMFAKIATDISDIHSKLETPVISDEQMEHFEDEIIKKASKRVEDGINAIMSYDPFDIQGE